ncbi:hypothetical protein QBC37DRAFT_449742 [Rhypophila decipiens]|uniref:Uncharacterized protein n=1 Tax=Rhypophila decipiens TaxID=261697 RepID=A0AAN6XZS5_9PEZI|nr:hypothetical protein QBC37DRAFT_449742 [Rhypophila decipiens]
MAGNKKPEKSTTNKKTISGRQALQQGASPLFKKLPQEMRDKIYDQVFAYTRLSYGEKSPRRLESVRIKPAPHGLALLRTCHRVKYEIGDRWLRQVLFHFEDPLVMLDKLTALPHRLISQVRHVRMRYGYIFLSSDRPGDEGRWFSYNLLHALKLIPGLKADVLTVMGFMLLGGTGSQYDMLNILIRGSDGWKELHFLSCSSHLLGYADKWPTGYLREPQPAHWQTILNLRDGADSLPSVTIYRSKTAGGTPSTRASLMTNPSNWEPFQQTDTIGNGTYGTVEDANIMSTPNERDKEVLVIARRGKGVDYQEKKNSRYIEGDIRRNAPGKSWKEIRKMCIDDFHDMYADEDDRSFSDEDDLEPPGGIIDSYARVDEYEWTGLDDRAWSRTSSLL